MNTRTRVLILTVTGLMAATAIVGYTVNTRDAAAGTSPTGSIDLATADTIVFRDTAPGPDFGHIASVPSAHPDATPTVSSTLCDRFYAANNTAICLQRGGALPATYATVLDHSLHQVRQVKTAGFPNRARVSASGRMVSWTMFVQGDSYLSDDFSTRTAILDTKTGRLIDNVESIPLTLDGKPYQAADVNYWGITFAADDNTFYATVRTAGRTYLVQGDYRAWTARTLRENVECPSLSPDGTRIVFKKRVNASANRPWRLYVLDLRTMVETPLADEHSIDDQAAWLNNNTVMYGRPRQSGGDWDIWAVPADGGGSPRILIPDASSPTPLGTDTGP
ncbi:PD40 domain-containing protein [Catenulispora sp. NL8]|uniref:PD40 domain-containing protein n=1 Tax=Catenulispora pinistramenti TaxID=2705254 RepID=A0ABS5KU13_9ACTN|nr:PD40 domain-containing protein [Catenulispora pinistramenti]MBS2549542.1 PD40 domain-containing protein [Catenulispora pinistramenti]